MSLSAHNAGFHLLRAKSLKIAPIGQEFTLASGKKSRVYLDVRKTALSPEGHILLGAELTAIIMGSFPNADLVAGVALGGCPLASAVSMTSAMAERANRRFPAVYVRKEAKSHGTSSNSAKPILVEGPYEPGQKVVLLEDVITSGGSSEKAVEELRRAGLEVLGVITVVDREEGGKEVFERLGIPFHRLWTMSEILEGAL